MLITPVAGVSPPTSAHGKMAVVVPPSLPPPSRIQRFEVIEQLGSGAMGAVYRARDLQLERDVAIKLLARPVAAARDALSARDTIDLRGEARDDLLDEARIMARLSHPNVLPVYEVGLAEGGVFLVMEHVAGADLRTWLATPRSTRAILAVFAQAARGLAAAHGRGVVHGDFKPENVLVGDDDRVRVADFGLSRLTARAAPLLRIAPAIGGTPHYMAPELWRGAAATERSDVFALCTALTEALGHEPGDRAALDRVLGARGCSRRLIAALAAGLAEDPQARVALDELIAALAPRRSRRWWWVAGAGAGAAIAAAAFALWARGAEPGCEAQGVRWAGRWDAERRAQLAAIGAADAVDKLRRSLDDALGAVCSAERRGELTTAQARGRTSCLERRGFELDATATRVVAAALAPDAAREAIESLSSVAACAEIVAPALPADREPARALYARFDAADAMAFAVPERTAALAAIERDARALGERELEALAATWLGMRQIETDDLAAADASLARGYDLAVAIRAAPIAVIALVERAIAAEQRGDASAARSYGKLAVEFADKPDAPPRRRVFVYFGLGRAELAHGDATAALALLRKALAILGTDEGRNLRREISVRFVVISALERLGGGREVEALALARENLALSRKVLGEHHVDYGTALNVVAFALRENHDVAGALDLRRRALDVMARGLPADHSVVLGQRMNVAADLFASGAFEAARAEAVAVLARAEGNQALRAARGEWTADLGAFTFAIGRTTDGLRLFEQGLDELVSQRGQDHPDSLDYRLERIGLELELGRLDDAERHADALERSYRARTDQALALARLDGVIRAELALARGRPRDAEARARTGLAAWRELHGDDGDREDLLRILGASLVDQRRWNEALEPLDGAAAIARERRELGDRRARIDLERARALDGQGKRGDAVELVRGARVALERFPGALRARRQADALLARWRAR